MIVRKARKSDIPFILRLLLQVNKVHSDARPDLFKPATKYSAAELERLLEDEANPVFVGAEEDGEVLGYAICKFVQHKNDSILTDIKTLYIDDLCVDEKLRGKRVGRTIYDFVLDFARESGCYNVTLNVWACNPSAIKFYEKCGLVPQKIGMEKIL